MILYPENPPILDYKSKILLGLLIAILQEVVTHNF